MKRLPWQLWLGALLVVLSAALYLLHYAIFRDAHHIWIYLLGDIAFVPVEVLLVALILHRILSAHEKRALRHKLNMVIGAFFSEVGSDLIRALGAFDPEAAALQADLSGAGDWPDPRFAQESRRRRAAPRPMDPRRGDLAALRTMLLGKREFLLRLLENPNLLEHATFTDLLWAVFHLTEELAHRRDLAALPDTDLEHLAGDLRRAHALLVAEWLLYMRHLKRDYPYLFSLAVRTNPFNPKATAEVR